MNALFAKIFSTIVPPEYLNTSCIAGGAAVDATKAGDIDLYIYRVTDDADQQDVRTALQLQRIRGLEFTGEEISDYTGPMKHIATVSSPLYEIQIIVSECSDIRELLSNFDLSTHCVAVSPDGTETRLPGTLGPPASPRLVFLRNPDKTLIRYRKLCRRYGLKPELETLKVLCTVDDQPEGSDINLINDSYSTRLGDEVEAL